MYESQNALWRISQQDFLAVSHSDPPTQPQLVPWVMTLFVPPAPTLYPASVLILSFCIYFVFSSYICISFLFWLYGRRSWCRPVNWTSQSWDLFGGDVTCVSFIIINLCLGGFDLFLGLYTYFFCCWFFFCFFCGFVTGAFVVEASLYVTTHNVLALKKVRSQCFDHVPEPAKRCSNRASSNKIIYI